MGFEVRSKAPDVVRWERPGMTKNRRGTSSSGFRGDVLYFARVSYVPVWESLLQGGDQVGQDVFEQLDNILS